MPIPFLVLFLAATMSFFAEAFWAFAGVFWALPEAFWTEYLLRSKRKAERKKMEVFSAEQEAMRARIAIRFPEGLEETPKWNGSPRPMTFPPIRLTTEQLAEMGLK